MLKKISTSKMPKLRFPEFLDASTLHETTIGDISGQITAGGTPNTSESSYWNGKLRWMNSGDLNLKKIYEVQGRITEDGLRHSSTKVIPAKCVLIGLAGQGKTRGTVAMNMVPLCPNQSIAAIFPNATVFDSDFLYHNLDNRYEELRKLSAGGEGRGGLNLQLIKSLKIALPSLSEQKKIADCLTSLEELTVAQEQKVEQLKTHKRGLMQQLFPREGETLPRFRFPEFREAPDWEEVKARELFSNRSEKGNVNLPIYSVTMTEGLVKRSSLERRIDDLADAEGNKKAHKNDIAYNMMRMWQGACGVAPEDCMVSPAYVILAPQSGVHPDFYGYYFKLPHMLQTFFSHSRGLTKDRLRLYFQDFSRILLPCPDIREQRRIAHCLHSIDAQTFSEHTKLIALKKYKKGLMQKLFHTSEEE